MFRFCIDGQFYSEQKVIKAFLPYASRISAEIDSLPDEITYDNYHQASKHFDSMGVKGYPDAIGMSGFIRKGVETAYLTEYGLDTDRVQMAASPYIRAEPKSCAWETAFQNCRLQNF